ncbi:MAG: protein kinase, partial [Candidatus Thiodiazotropha sp.]
MANLLESGFLQTQNTGTFKTDYEYLESVGQGGFGEVFKAKYKHDDHIYAVKKVRFDQFKNKYQLHLIRRELVNNAKLSHENVVRYYHSWIEVSDDQNVYDDSITESTSGTRETTAGGEEGSKDVFLATNITAARISNNDQNLLGLHNQLRFWHSESLKSPFKDANEHRENMKLSAVGKSGFRTKASVKDTDDDDSDNFFMDFKAGNKTETHNIPKLEEFFEDSDAECVAEDWEYDIESDADFGVEETEVSGNENNKRTSSVAETDEDINEDQNSPDGYHGHIVQQFSFDIEDVFDEIDNSVIQSRSANHSDETAVSGEEDETESPRFYELYIKMEFCDYTLRDRIDEGLLVNDEIRCWNFFRQLIRGLDYIHNQHVIHRDLNPKNVFVTNNDIVKIGDFGLSRIKG